MESQDPGHGYFTDLLNEDHVLDDSSYVWQNETSPGINDNSPPFPSNEEIINIRKSVRGVNFTPGEDKLLVSAWLNTSIDAIKVLTRSTTNCGVKSLSTLSNIKKPQMSEQ